MLYFSRPMVDGARVNLLAGITRPLFVYTKIAQPGRNVNVLFLTYIVRPKLNTQYHCVSLAFTGFHLNAIHR